MSTTTSAARTSPLKVASASLVGYTLAQTCGAAFAPLIAASLYGATGSTFRPPFPDRSDPPHDNLIKEV